MSANKIMYVATNLTDLHAEPSFLSELLTQVTNGVELEILEEQEKWCRVRQRDGYEGWAYMPYLTDQKPIVPTHIANLTQSLFDSSDPGPPRTSLVIGTAVRVIETKGNWSRVRFCADAMLQEGWTYKQMLRDLSRLPMESARARVALVSEARGLTGTYYLWGGCTDWGTDCSGLVQLCHRLCGYEIPRDARLQFPAAKCVDPPFQPGDLLFFHSETNKDKITHVGISTGEQGGWNMIHSSRTRNGVYQDNVQAVDHLRATFAGARSFL